jgi:cytochrome c peroxidase
MKLFFKWVRKTFYREISENPLNMEKLVNRTFYPMILIFPIITLYINFPGEPELPFHPKKAETLQNEIAIPIPTSLNLQSKKVEIGKALFMETKISDDGKTSCNTCHDLTQGGTIRKFVENQLNPPTIYNSGNYYRDRDDSEEEKREIAVQNLIHFPKEYGDYNKNLTSLLQTPTFKDTLSKIYGNNVELSMVYDSLKEFIISLSTPNSRFDKYLNGDLNALTVEEREGYLLFKEIGCSSCHQGMNLGGNITQKLGINNSYLRDKEIKTDLDLGLFLKTGKEEDKYKFKVPSLRNISITYPYLHDGRYETLRDVVIKMSRYQLGKELSEDESKKLILFLETLTGEYNGRVLE